MERERYMSSEIDFYDNQETPTVVVRALDYPMAELPTLFHRVFGALFPALVQRQLTPTGAPFSLYTRAPSETVDLEIGVPVSAALAEQIVVGDVVLEPSVLPAGAAARTSYFGGYDGLGQAWGSFMGAVARAGRAPSFPFWEVYVTEPTPELDPSTLQTDLHTLVEEAD